MSAPSARELLDVWEAGHAHDHTVRALLLLACAAVPDGADLPIGRRDALLLDLRERLFGQRIDAVERCPACLVPLDVTFDIADVRIAGDPIDQLDLHIDSYDITARLPTSRDLLAASASPDVSSARATLLERSLVGANPNELPVAVLERVVAALGEADPQAEVELALTCAECGVSWQTHFDIVSYLWSEIEQLGHQTLRDVHMLARAYGWDEDVVLRLPPWRRQYYLEMIADG